MRKKILLVAVCAALFANGVFAQRAEDVISEVDRYLLPYVEMKDFSGQVLIARKGKIIAQKGYGQSNYELGIPNGPQTRFHIASLSKTFTAAAIVLLAKDGKLRMDEKLGKYVPDYPAGKEIRISQLLSHSAGVPDFGGLNGYEDLMTSGLSHSDWLELIKSRPLDFEPGTNNSYSNAGYALLAEVIEKASGEQYGAFLQKKIFGPLGMKNTGQWTDGEVLRNRASGYDPSYVSEFGLTNTHHYNKSVLWGSGSLYSTAEDLFIWYKAIHEGKLFSLDSLEYPFGWGVRKRFGRDLIEQDGNDPGFAAHISAYLKDDLCIIVLSNIRTGAINKIKEDLAAIALNEQYTPVKTRKLVKVPSNLLEDYAGRYRLGPKMTLTVKTDDGAVYLKGTGGSFLPLEPLSETTFFYPQFYVSIVFSRNKEGKVDKMLWDGSFAIDKVLTEAQSP
ncbi:MAG: serine hydrolase [Acidobacteriota bacterium]|nr:MAG: serine hydrolase [Acidobacteriota bacterium]